eukprot:5286791-Pyramimonas_sp.AAC.1
MKLLKTIKLLKAKCGRQGVRLRLMTTRLASIRDASASAIQKDDEAKVEDIHILRALDDAIPTDSDEE